MNSNEDKAVIEVISFMRVKMSLLLNSGGSPESDGRVDWSSTFAGRLQELSSPTKLMLQYSRCQTKKLRGQRIDDSQASATAEGVYESIEPVHEYKDVLPQGKASREDYVKFTLPLRLLILST